MTRPLIFISLIILSVLSAAAQRKVTPVETDDKKPPTPTLHYYDKHGKPLEEPVLFLATLDTISTKKVSPKPIYPKLSEINVGLNIFDGVAVLAGSHYGGADLWANVGLWNWLFPTLELGIGAADKQPEGNNFTYKGKPSFYAKIGTDYNFLYKSNPKYQLFVGVRLGFSAFRYSLENVTLSSGYWDQTQTLNFDSLSGSALYGEGLFGIKVNLLSNFSMGWTIRARFLMNNKIAKTSPIQGAPFGAEITPSYIPGYGPRTSHFGFTFSLIYTLPFYQKKATPELAPQAEES